MNVSPYDLVAEGIAIFDIQPMDHLHIEMWIMNIGMNGRKERMLRTASEAKRFLAIGKTGC